MDKIKDKRTVERPRLDRRPLTWKGTWFWMAPCGQELDVVRVERRQTGQGSDSTSLFPFLSVPRTSSLHHPKSSDILCRRVHNTTATVGSHLVKQVILRWAWPTHWTLKRLALSPTGSSYKLLLSWMSGRPFSLRCCSSHWLHSLLYSSAHTPNSPSPATTRPQNLVFQDKWNT